MCRLCGNPKEPKYSKVCIKCYGWMYFKGLSEERLAKIRKRYNRWAKQNRHKTRVYIRNWAKKRGGWPKVTDYQRLYMREYRKRKIINL